MYTTGHAKAYHVGFFLLITILLSIQLSLLSVRTGHRSSQHYDRLQCLIYLDRRNCTLKETVTRVLLFNLELMTKN